ncbi:hypothetical protein WOLCODRAFT_16533 [Wolfiporia cocos MD-104 SS10]|uniref:Uncharacterized protein n=1 Tax=Wolfiporia cocos (strain MD-104) TaxID=742152 RepID=A0A2H3JE17_WOLCO|nr:hypothetical protein WOLCODRAFT_16533 [Wolfiporia cocos MD-104 SS10]
MAAPRPEFGDSLGAILLDFGAQKLHRSLYGITTIQTYTYYKRGRTEPVFMKLLLSELSLDRLLFFGAYSDLLWFLSSVHLALVTYTTYNYAVIDFANPLAMKHVIWSVPFILQTHMDMPSVLYASWPWFSLPDVGVGLEIHDGRRFSLASFDDASQSDFSRVLYLGLGSIAFGDSLIAATLTVLLSRRRTGFSSIQTGTLTSLCAIACLIAGSSVPEFAVSEPER